MRRSPVRPSTRASPRAVEWWLSLLRIRHTFLVLGRFRGTSGVTIEGEGTAAFHYCAAGSCLVEPVGGPPLRLATGDFLFMRSGIPRAVWAGDGRRQSPPVALRSVAPPVRRNGAVSFAVGRGLREHVVLGGAFCILDPEARLFVDSLPATFVVHRGDRYTARLGALVKELIEEAIYEPSESPIVARLAEVAVLMGVRSFATTQGNSSPLIAAARHPRLGRALEVIHRDPAQGWTVERLGRVAGMSRSSFAQEFVELLGEPPAAYLARVRIARAEQLMSQPDWSLSRIAEAVGYSSAAAFSVAFKRMRGKPPFALRRGAVAAP